MLRQKVAVKKRVSRNDASAVMLPVNEMLRTPGPRGYVSITSLPDGNVTPQEYDTPHRANVDGISPLSHPLVPLSPDAAVFFPSNQDTRSHITVGRNSAVLGEFLRGKVGSLYHRKMAAAPKFIPPDSVVDPTEDRVLAQPLATGTARYHWWSTPYVEDFARFAHKHRKLLDEITSDDFMKVLAISAQAYSHCHTEGISMHNFSNKKLRTRTLFTARACRYLGCRREPMDGTDFRVTSIKDGQWMFDYSYRGDNHADKEFFLHFVRARMAMDVTDDEIIKLISDGGMEKYITLPCNRFLNNEGNEALHRQRSYRTQTLHSNHLIKMSMTTTSTIPCTVDKYNFKEDVVPPGTVLVYGSGGSHCAMRYNWRSTYCVDPLWDGPPELGFRGHHYQFHQHLTTGAMVLPFVPVLIASDACWYHDQTRTLLVGARGNHELRNKTRAMDPGKTNQISSEIVEYWLGRGYTGAFYMKSGLFSQFPASFADLKAHGAIKTRPSNSEVVVWVKGGVVESDDGKSPTSGPELTWARCVNQHNINVVVANNQRMRHEKERSFPKRKFAFPANMNFLLENARNNIILPAPPTHVVVNRRELSDRKRMERGFDPDDAEHSSDRSLLSGEIDSDGDSDAEDYFC